MTCPINKKPLLKRWYVFGSVFATAISVFNFLYVTFLLQDKPIVKPIHVEISIIIWICLFALAYTKHAGYSKPIRRYQ